MTDEQINNCIRSVLADVALNTPLTKMVNSKEASIKKCKGMMLGSVGCFSCPCLLGEVERDDVKTTRVSLKCKLHDFELI